LTCIEASGGVVGAIRHRRAGKTIYKEAGLQGKGSGRRAGTRGGGGDVETGDEKDAAVPVAQKDPRVLSSHARHGSCAGRRVDGAKLASGAVAASRR